MPERVVSPSVSGTGAPSADRTADPVDGWQILTRISPRDHIRVAAVDHAGDVLNLYTSLRAVDADAPSLPWAMFLTDDLTGRQHFVVFDLDASRGNAAADADRLVTWLTELGIEHTVCASGPAGGRHVWLALIDPIPPSQARALALTAALVLPTLDRSSTTGCVRPPGSPHRHGGRSEILAGPTGTDALRPAVTAVQIDALHETIHAAATTATRASAPDPGELHDDHQIVPLDDSGAPYLPGRRRPLSAAIARAITETPADPSRTLRRILTGAAVARWHRDDIANLMSTSPGLEHLRTRHQPHGPRTPRTPLQQDACLARKWAAAVQWAATHQPQTPHDDPSWTHRAGTVGQLVDDVQTRADATPGRWASRTGHSARRVLDAICLLVTTAVTATVEADVRRLAITTGLGRETVRLRLHELAEAGLLTLTTPATGRRAHHWTLNQPAPAPGQIHPQSAFINRSQGEAAPSNPHPSPALRTAWTLTLTRRFDDLAHDLWTAQGLGHQAGQIHAALSDQPTTPISLVARTHLDLADVRTALDTLIRHRLAIVDRRGQFRRARIDRRDDAAHNLAVAGTLAARAERYAREKELWAWWCDELDWMRLPATAPGKRRDRRLATGQLDLTTGRVRGRMPRTAGKVDHQAARAVVFAA